MRHPGMITPDHPDHAAWEAWYAWATRVVAEQDSK
jgi:hypothetical protein